MDIRPFNPLVETLVHPPLKVEVPEPYLLTKLVLRLQAFGGRGIGRRGNAHRFQHKLPPELWLIILDFVLAPMLRTHEAAHCDTIPPMMRTLFRFGTHVLPYDDWPRLRLVCGMFHGLLGPNRYQGIRGQKDDRALPTGVEALSMIIQDEPMSSFTALRDPSALSKIRLFDIALASRTADGETAQGIMNTLYTLAPNLPSLRSLSLYFGGIGRSSVLKDDTWHQISHSFPLLEHLCLWANQPITACKPATLKNIRTLTTQHVPDTDFVRFPSLLGVFTFRWNPNSAFEKLHAYQLISLGVSDRDIGVDHNILHLSPNLRRLEGPIFSLINLDLPPVGHPVKHLGITLPYVGDVEATLHKEIPRLVQKLRQMPNINRLLFGRGGGLSSENLKFVLDSLGGTNVASVFAEA